jgi:hypothetical protein
VFFSRLLLSPFRIGLREELRPRFVSPGRLQARLLSPAQADFPEKRAVQVGRQVQDRTRVSSKGCREFCKAGAGDFRARSFADAGCAHTQH